MKSKFDECAASRPLRAVIPIVAAGGLYEAHKKVYPRQTHGVFSRWRWTMVFATQLLFYGLP